MGKLSQETMNEIAKVFSRTLKKVLLASQASILKDTSTKDLITLSQYYKNRFTIYPDNKKLALTPEEIEELSELVKRSLESYPLYNGVCAGSFSLFVRDALKNLQHGLVNNLPLSEEAEETLTKISKWVSTSQRFNFGIEQKGSPYCSYGYRDEFTIGENMIKLDGSKKSKEELLKEMINYASSWWGQIIKEDGYDPVKRGAYNDNDINNFRGIFGLKIKPLIKELGFLELSLTGDDIMSIILLDSRIYKVLNCGQRMVITDGTVAVQNHSNDPLKVIYTLEGGEQETLVPIPTNYEK